MIECGAARLTFSKISEAFAVQMKGFGWSLWWSTWETVPKWNRLLFVTRYTRLEDLRTAHEDGLSFRGPSTVPLATRRCYEIVGG